MEEAGVVRAVENRALTSYEIGLLASLIVDEPDHYTVLGVLRDASEEDIRTAYCIAVEHFHPLKSREMTEADSVMHWKLSSAFVRIEEAFAILSNRSRRKVYDDKLSCKPMHESEQSMLSEALVEPERNERPGVHRKRRNERPDLAKMSFSRQSTTRVDDERRRTDRVLISLPMRVTFERQWQELTQTEDVSPLGVRFRLSRRVEPGARLRLEMPLPKHLRTHSFDDHLYIVNAFVIKVSQENRKSEVVAEFI